MRRFALIAALALAIPSGQAIAEPLDVTDVPSPAIHGRVHTATVGELVDTPQSAPEAAQAAIATESEYLDVHGQTGAEIGSESLGGYSGYVAEYSELYNTDGPSHEMPGWHDGYLETYYSDTVMRHYMSDQWTVDSEGFYRDDQGRYIVGVDIAEGIALGTEVETGKGTAVVMDYGSGAKVHDFYVHGW